MSAKTGFGKHIPCIVIPVLAVCAGTLSAADTSRPNIILCMADDQGWGDMAYNGHPKLKTPVFDEMARTGLRFNRFYAAAPVCSPTRGSVLTGRTPHRYGVFSWGHSLRPQEVTVAEVLREAGYATGHFGKWHLGSVLPDSPTSPGSNGFQEWVSAPNFFEIDPWLSRKGKAERHRGEGSEIVVREALQFVRRSVEAKRPFLAVVWFGSPHAPHSGIEIDLALYKDETPKQQRFLAEITAMDRAMGMLRDGLREFGVSKQTLLWYCSDNGAIAEGSTGGLRGQKGTLYEGGLRVPCLVEWPERITAHRVMEVPSGTFDIYPTLLDIVDATPAHQPVLDGESLLPVFDGKAATRTKPMGFWDAGIAGFGTPSDRILSGIAQKQASGEPVTEKPALGLPPAPLEWPHPAGIFPGHAVWQHEGWKLHRIADKAGSNVRWQLFHLANDDRETKELSQSEPDRLTQMQNDLTGWLESVTGSLKGADYK